MAQDKSSNRIALGRFFHELLENTLLTHAAKPLHIYSAHDVTLAAFLAALDLFDGGFLSLFSAIMNAYVLCNRLCTVAIRMIGVEDIV